MAMRKSSSNIANQGSNDNSIPSKYIWPENELVPAEQELQEYVVDLEGFFKGDKEATLHAANLVRASCLQHGLFQVINHGVDSDIMKITYEHAKAFFMLPIDEKQKGAQQPGKKFGYSIAHSTRYSSKLPWTEFIVLGFPYNGSDDVVVEFFKSNFGNEFAKMGMVFQKYCEAMKKLSLALMEIIALSLGLDQTYFKDFYEDGGAFMKANCYPICPEPGLTLGIGAHKDQTSLTILHQDQVGGLEVFGDGEWKSVRPRNGAFIIGIGDTFSALTNGVYKSFLHRVRVNKHQDRMSLAFFLNPKGDKVVKAPEALISEEERRKFPEFTWNDFQEFTFKYYRVNDSTLENFVRWIEASKPALEAIK